MLGPFFPNDIDTDFLADTGGEAAINPKEGDPVITADGTTLIWKRYTAKGNIIDLTDAVGNHENATAYAFCSLQSKTSGDAQIRLGFNDGVAVWINGQQVHLNPDRSPSLDSDVFEVDLKAGANRCLVKVSNETSSWIFSMRVLSTKRAVISGIITDENGNPIRNADVHLEQDEEEVLRTSTDENGNYSLDIYPAIGQYDIAATSDEEGAWNFGIRLREGERQTLNLRLTKAVSIEGTLLMLDDKTPHVAVSVQAIRDGKIVDGTFSDENGKYRFINLKPGDYQVRCQVPDGYVYYSSSSNDNGMGEEIGEILQVEKDKTLEVIDFRFAPFKKGIWQTYRFVDGLSCNDVTGGILQDSEGAIWIGTFIGVSRYDGKSWIT